MKTFSILLALAVASFASLTAQAQTGRTGLGGATAKLFGEHQTFTAAMEFEVADPNTKLPITMPGKMSFDGGKSRFEMNMTEIKGSQIPPDAAVQLKAMGMDTTVNISRPDKNVSYVIYPGMQSYLETPLSDKSTAARVDEFKTEITELGKETVDGHPCVKNKVVVTDKEKVAHESTVWNAKDLKNFPVKIETSESGAKTVMHFKTVNFEKPAASVFEVPAGMTKHASLQAMMQAVMMKQMGGAAAHPPGR